MSNLLAGFSPLPHDTDKGSIFDSAVGSTGNFGGVMFSVAVSIQAPLNSRSFP